MRSFAENLKQESRHDRSRKIAPISKRTSV